MTGRNAEGSRRRSKVEAGASRPLSSGRRRVVRTLALTAALDLVLGVLGLVATIVVGLDSGDALTFFLVGAAFFTLIVVLRTGRPRVVDAGRPRSLLIEAVSPSSVMLALLVAIALAFDTRISALLAGFLAGKGLGIAGIGAFAALVRR